MLNLCLMLASTLMLGTGTVEDEHDFLRVNNKVCNSNVVSFQDITLPNADVSAA